MYEILLSKKTLHIILSINDQKIVSSIIKKYGEITPADQLSEKTSPCFKYYPYVSYLELRKMINAILIHDEKERQKVSEEVSKKRCPLNVPIKFVDD